MTARMVIESPTPAMAAAHGTGVATVDELSWNDERLRVTARGNAVLVVSDLYYPGWKATVDGRDTPIRPANLAMRAIAG